MNIPLIIILLIIGFVIFISKNINEDNRLLQLSAIGVAIFVLLCGDFKGKISQDKTSGKYETECRRILETTFNKTFAKVRPNFLRNPKTGKNLELDMYNEQLKLACEYDGPQHHHYFPLFHKSPNDYYYQVEKDNFKKSACKKQGICLINVPHTVEFKKLDPFIKSALKDNNFLK